MSNTSKDIRDIIAEQEAERFLMRNEERFYNHKKNAKDKKKLFHNREKMSKREIRKKERLIQKRNRSGL